MQVINNIAQFPKIENAVVTVGSFDGVHLGHHKLFQQLKETTQTHNGKSVVITFEPHPQKVLQKDSSFFCINTFEQKVELLEREQVDYLLIIPFTKQFSEMSSTQFIQKILIDIIGTKILIMGPNHNIGRNREGDFPSIRTICEEKNISVVLIDECTIHDIAIRSTEIRRAILRKDFATAETLLGHTKYQKEIQETK